MNSILQRFMCSIDAPRLVAVRRRQLSTNVREKSNPNFHKNDLNSFPTEWFYRYFCQCADSSDVSSGVYVCVRLPEIYLFHVLAREALLHSHTCETPERVRKRKQTIGTKRDSRPKYRAKEQNLKLKCFICSVKLQMWYTRMNCTRIAG